MRFGGYTLTTGTPAPHYFSIAAVGNEISRVVANPSLPALGPIPRSLGALALILLAYSALRGRMRGARSRLARSLLAGSGRAH